MATSKRQITIDLPSGPILAQEEQDLIYARGIRYAEAGRFRRPQPVAIQKNAPDCTKPATICPQNPSWLEVATGPLTNGRKQDEDCLHVSVAAPKDAKNLPVMVFIHGGAFVTGGGDLACHSPKPLARHGVVVVTVTYRVGVFGWLRLPGIAPANLGLQDQILALRWVKENISSFGGNPNQVTLFGQSAGAMSIYCLLVTEDAKHLFHRVIIESAYYDWPFEPDREKMLAGLADFTTTELPSIAQSSVSPEEILPIQAKLVPLAASLNKTFVGFAPVFGEYPLPPLSELTSRLRDTAKDVPMLIGYTKNDGAAFVAADAKHRSEPDLTKEMFWDGANRLNSEITKVTGGSPMYEFTWSPEGNKWGATHCIELPFLLGGFDDWPNAPMLKGPGSQESVDRLGTEVKKLWSAFAKGADFGAKKFVLDGNFKFEG